MDGRRQRRPPRIGDRGRLTTLQSRTAAQAGPGAPHEAGRSSSGTAAGLGAYVLWGLFPLYFPLLEPAGPVEILAHRVAWTAVTCAVVLAALRRGVPWRGLRARQLGLLTVAAVMIAVNWGVYIAAVNTGHVVEAALGYFINPLVSVLLGVGVLGERLRRLGWAAVAVAAAGVGVLTAAYGRVPWIALVPDRTSDARRALPAATLRDELV